MKIRTKILLLFTLGAIVPLMLSHFFSMRLLKNSLRDQVESGLVHQATQTAGRLEDASSRFIADVRTATYVVPFDRLSGPQLRQALEVPYRLVGEATIVALIDESGKAVVSPYYKDEAQSLALGRRPIVQEDLSVFSRNIPLSLSLQAEVAVGPVYFSSKGEPRISMTRAIKVTEKGPTWVFAVELALNGICDRVRAAAEQKGVRVSLFDFSRRAICDEYKGEEISTEIAAVLFDGPTSSYIDRDGVPTITSSSDIEGVGWTLVVEQSEKIVFAPAVESSTWAGFWAVLSLMIALAGGFVIAKGLSDPITKLATVAEKIAGGDYDQRLKVTSHDEVGGLAKTFNRMTGEIQKWNDELVRRVEERTEELREAHEQIMHTQKLAAIGELGSGVAHEVNNPLAALIGTAQLLQCGSNLDEEMKSGLDDIVTSARRVADIVDSLLRLSQTQLPFELEKVVAAKLVEEVLEMFAGRFEERRIDLDLELDRECRVFAAPNDLKLALSQVVDNAVRALGMGGRIRVRIEKSEGGVVKIVVHDNGGGMSNTVRSRAFEPFFTTNDPSSGSKGLGLPLVHRIVSEHNGRIVLKSEVDNGTTVKIYIPGATRLSRQV